MTWSLHYVYESRGPRSIPTYSVFSRDQLEARFDYVLEMPCHWSPFGMDRAPNCLLSSRSAGEPNLNTVTVIKTTYQTLLA